MAEYIEKETALEIVKRTSGDYAAAFSEIAHLPAAAVAEVVRCRECKHYHAETGWCDQLSYFQTSDGEPCSPAKSMDWKMFQENDFCSFGERRDE